MSQLTSPRAVVLPAAEELNHAALDAPNGLEDMNEIVAEPSAQPTLSCVELQSSEVNAAQKISPPVLRVPPVAMQRAASVNIAKAAASPPGISARPRLLRRQETSSMLKEARLKRFNERHGIATAMELQRQVTQHRAWILESQVKQQAFWGRVPVLIPAKHPLLGRWDAVTTLALIYVRERRSSRRPYTRGRAASCDPPPPHAPCIKSTLGTTLESETHTHAHDRGECATAPSPPDIHAARYALRSHRRRRSPHSRLHSCRLSLVLHRGRMCGSSSTGCLMLSSCSTCASTSLSPIRQATTSADVRGS